MSAAQARSGRRRRRRRHRARLGRRTPRAPTAGPTRTGGATRSRASTSGGWAVALGAVVLAVLAGLDHDRRHRPRACRRPPRTSSPARGTRSRAVGDAVGGAYAALFRGAIYNYTADTFAQAIRPLTQSLTYATPLIAGRPRHRDRLPLGHVQHRRPGADAHGGGRPRAGSASRSTCRPGCTWSWRWSRASSPGRCGPGSRAC